MSLKLFTTFFARVFKTHVVLQAADRGAAAQDFVEGSGEIDPLDAFMAENEQQVEAAEAEEEVDPLDAFMAELAPTVRKDMAGTAQTAAANGPVAIKVEDGAAPASKQVCSQDLYVLFYQHGKLPRHH